MAAWGGRSDRSPLSKICRICRLLLTTQRVHPHGRRGVRCRNARCRKFSSSQRYPAGWYYQLCARCWHPGCGTIMTLPDRITAARNTINCIILGGHPSRAPIHQAHFATIIYYPEESQTDSNCTCGVGLTNSDSARLRLAFPNAACSKTAGACPASPV